MILCHDHETSAVMTMLQARTRARGMFKSYQRAREALAKGPHTLWRECLSAKSVDPSCPELLRGGTLKDSTKICRRLHFFRRGKKKNRSTRAFPALVLSTTNCARRTRLVTEQRPRMWRENCYGRYKAYTSTPYSRHFPTLFSSSMRVRSSH